jgi:hypothetical protein
LLRQEGEEGEKTGKKFPAYCDEIEGEEEHYMSAVARWREKK